MANIKIPALTELTSIAIADKFVVEDNSASQTKFARADTIVDSGSNSNGSWVRYYDGTQICRVNNFQAAYKSGNDMNSVWTYPATFVAGDPVAVVVTLAVGGSTLTPPPRDITTSHFARGNTSAEIRMQNITGATDFASGDTGYLDVTAHGRWY